MYINQRDTQILVDSPYFFVKWLYMFRTIISPKHVQSFNEKKNKDYSQEFVHVVGSYTHCNMMHGTYNVKISTCPTLNVGDPVSLPYKIRGKIVCVYFIFRRPDILNRMTVWTFRIASDSMLELELNLKKCDPKLLQRHGALSCPKTQNYNTTNITLPTLLFFFL